MLDRHFFLLPLRKVLKEKSLNSKPSDLKIKVLHSSEFLASRIQDESLSFKKTGKKTTVTLDDDPFLARYLFLSDPPRSILNALPGVTLVEMMYHKVNAFPGTAFLGLPQAQAAVKISEVRMEEAVKTNAEILVTTSPFSKKDLSAVNQTSLKIMDLNELVLEFC